jgi:hypothetical protein
MNVARTILVGLPLLAGCATEPSRAETLRAQYREGAALQTRHAGDPAYRSPEGFQQSRWGMSMDEVHALYPQAQLEGSTLQLDAPLAERPAHVTFRFSANRLSEVRAALLQPQGQFDGLANLLGRKYGKPSSITPDAQDDAMRSAANVLEVVALLSLPPEHGFIASQNVQTHRQLDGLAAGTEPRGAFWVRPETRITLAQGSGELVIDYLARALPREDSAGTGPDGRAAGPSALDSL